MGYTIVNERNEPVGWSESWFEAAPGQKLVADDVAVLSTIEIKALITQKQAQIKTEVTEKLAETNWRLERAQERDALGVAGESVADVLAAREAIRRAGNRAEAEVAELGSVEAINNYRWQVVDSDYPTPSKVTRLAFVRLFSNEERAAIYKAKAKNQALADWWQMLDLAININLKDPEIMTGVYYLEKAGLLAKGRAQEILGGAHG